MNKATVQRYRQTLTGSSSKINQVMSAVKKMAQEAADNGMLDQGLSNGVSRVHGAPVHGIRSGNWLTRDQAQSIILAPDVLTLKGLRDRAILAVMIGAGLRRSEVAALTVEHIQQRDGRWIIVDMMGKGQHVRSVPIAAWVKLAIDEWCTAANVASGVIFRAIHKGGYITRETMSPQGISDVVMFYAAKIGVPKLTAHDCRRTFAKLAKRGGSDIQQIQLSLGHLSSKTTERYLGTEQDLNDAPADRLGLSLSD
jgi:integrase